MMHAQDDRTIAASALAALGLAWPTILCAITDALQTPVQRAMASSWCGGGPQAAEFLGHCAACWIGAGALLAAAAALKLGVNPRRGLRAAT
jgi:hypothetical protein